MLVRTDKMRSKAAFPPSQAVPGQLQASRGQPLNVLRASHAGLHFSFDPEEIAGHMCRTKEVAWVGMAAGLTR